MAKFTQIVVAAVVDPNGEGVVDSLYALDAAGVVWFLDAVGNVWVRQAVKRVVRDVNEESEEEVDGDG